MEKARLPLRVVFYYEQDRWIAHCLEFDLLGDGESKDEAMASLRDAIELQIHASIENDNSKNLFSPAPGRFFEMYATGRHVALAALTFSADGVEIERVEAREASRLQP